jgi:cob(I)alamin adenosyltransferase
MSKIYTRRGDQGKTALRPGVVVDKHDSAIALLGDLDEMNCYLGVVLAGLLADELTGRLRRVQSQLFLVGANVAGDADSRQAWSDRAAEWVFELESEIDVWSELLPPLRNFILPGGSPGGAQLHLARAVMRRVERSLMAWQGSDADLVRPMLTPYLNRLSDWLFVAARYHNHRAGIVESVWTRALVAPER